MKRTTRKKEMSTQILVILFNIKYLKMSLEKLRYQFQKKTEKTGGVIQTEPEWTAFKTLITKLGLLTAADVKILEQSKPTFPCDFSCLAATITQVSKIPHMTEVSDNLVELEYCLTQVRGVLESWNVETLPPKDLAQLLIIIKENRDTFHEAHRTIKQIEKETKHASEDILFHVFDKVFAKLQKEEPAKSAIEFQENEYTFIEKNFHEMRVRAVQYRNRAVRVLKAYDNGAVVQLGFDAEKDTPVEVWKIPHDFDDFEFYTQFLHTISAQHQLILSKNFSNYLGFDDLTDPEYSLYFFEIYKLK